VLLEKKRAWEAIAHYEKALTISPDSEKAQTNLAWLLATSSEGSLRNGQRAIELAEQANRPENPVNLYVLAAAYAQNQQFDRALRTAQQALQLATVQKESGLADEIRRVIKLYQTGSAYREP
jgi:tetratricopeptide (TPR) repeat protein